MLLVGKGLGTNRDIKLLFSVGGMIRRQLLAPVVYMHRNSSLRANLRKYHRIRRVTSLWAAEEGAPPSLARLYKKTHSHKDGRFSMLRQKRSTTKWRLGSKRFRPSCLNKIRMPHRFSCQPSSRIKFLDR